MSEEGKVVKMANSGVSATSKEVQLLELTPAKEECGSGVARSSDGSREAKKFGNCSVKSPTLKMMTTNPIFEKQNTVQTKSNTSADQIWLRATCEQFCFTQSAQK